MKILKDPFEDAFRQGKRESYTDLTAEVRVEAHQNISRSNAEKKSKGIG